MRRMSPINLPDEVHDAIKTRARNNNRSAEAEVRAILIEALNATTKGGFGTRLRGCLQGVVGDDLVAFREKGATPPVSFE